MTRMITRGRLTETWAKAFLAAPYDREADLRRIVESAGAKMIDFYFLSGDCDFMIVSEAPDAADVVAATLAAKSRGAITDVTFSIAWTPAEFKAVGEKAAKAIYVLPGEK